MKFNITGMSMLELLEKYGKGEKGFYSNWWKDESFAKEKPLAGIYEIDFENKHLGLTYSQQEKFCLKGWGFPHPAVLLEAIFSHYEKIGKRLLEDYYSWTSSCDSDGELVSVGSFGTRGARVGGWCPGHSSGGLGVSLSRRLEDLKSGNSDKEKIYQDLMDIADKGEYEDMRREIEEYFKEKI